MIACLDVYYESTSARAAGLTLANWNDVQAIDTKVVEIASVQPYEPGQFYRRELPCLLAVLEKLQFVDTVVVDGYVWLDGKDKPGLGAHLYEALGRKSVVIGVAKTEFKSANDVHPHHAWQFHPPLVYQRRWDSARTRGPVYSLHARSTSHPDFAGASGLLESSWQLTAKRSGAKLLMPAQPLPTFRR